MFFVQVLYFTLKKQLLDEVKAHSYPEEDWNSSMDEDGLPIVGSGVDLTKVSAELKEANQTYRARKLGN